MAQEEQEQELTSSTRSEHDEHHRLLQQQLHRRKYMWSTIGLCGSVLSMFYFVMNVFPYSGFFALHLLNSDNTDNNKYTAATIGPYAGVIASAFQFGRITTSIAWGKCADVYGRKFVLVISLISMIVGNILFGLSTNYTMAVAVRFLAGVFSGTMVVARTQISELAKGDSELESKGTGLLMSMVGYGMLIGPALGGTLSEPLEQYPGFVDKYLGGPGGVWTTNILEAHPFVLPNLFGSLFTTIFLAIAMSSVEETLPEETRRDWKLVPMDISNKIGSCIRGCGESIWTTSPKKQYKRVYGGGGTDDDGYGFEHPNSNNYDDESKPLVPTNDPERQSLQNELRSSATGTAATTTSSSDRTSSSIWDIMSTTSNVRYYLYSYWCFAFTSVAGSEAFPLFAMTAISHGGLGLNESSIGMVQTIGGLIFLIGQYPIFSWTMKTFSLAKSMRLGALITNVYVLIPLALYIPTITTMISSTTTTTSIIEGGDGAMTTTTNWIQLGFLGLIMGITSISGTILIGCVSIGSNRSVEASQRASMQGLCGVGTSIGRALGPIFAGILVSSSMSGGIPSDYSAWVIFGVLFFLGLVSYFTTVIVPDDDNDNNNDSKNDDKK